MQKEHDVLSDQARTVAEASAVMEARACIGVEKTQNGNELNQKTQKGQGQTQGREAVQSSSLYAKETSTGHTRKH